jgi:WD40 repeat protein
MNDEARLSAGGRRTTLEDLHRTLDRSPHVLRDSPGALFPLLYNALQWSRENQPELARVLDAERRRYARPWMRGLARPAESPELIRTFQAAGARQRTAKFFPDATRLLSFNGRVFRLWDVGTGREMGLLDRGDGSELDTYEISPDGRRLAVVGGSEGRAGLFDLVRLAPICKLEDEPGQVAAVAFSPTGTILAAGKTGGVIDWWDAESGCRLGHCSRRDRVITHLAFDPSGARLLSGGYDGLRLWEAHTRRWLATLVGHTAWVDSCAFSSDGEQIVSAAGRELCLWRVDVGRLEPVWRIQERGKVKQCWFTPDGGAVCVTDNEGDFRLRDVETGDALTRAHTGTWHVAMSPDGTRLATARYWDERIYLWDMPPREPVAVLRGHTDDIDCVAFSPDSSLLVSVATDATVRLWDAKAAPRPDAWTGHRVGIGACCFHPNGDRLVSGGWDGVIMVWEVPGLRAIASARAYTDHVTALTLSLDGQLLLTCGDTMDGPRAKLWSVDPLREILAFPGPLQVSSCAFSPDGRLAALAGIGGQSRLGVWDVATLQQIRDLPFDEELVSELTFSPDGRRLFMVAKGGLSVWDLPDWSLSFLMHGATACGLPQDGRVYVALVNRSVCVRDNVNDADETLFWLEREVPPVYYSTEGLALNADATRAVAYSEDATAELWDLAERRSLGLLGDRPSCSCLFSPDGAILFTSERDGSVVLRDAGTGALLCRHPAGIGTLWVASFSADGRYVACGDDLGHLQLLALEGLEHRTGGLTSPWSSSRP